MMQAHPMSDMDVACNSLQWWEGESSISQGFLRLTGGPHGAFHCALEANSEMCPPALTLALVVPPVIPSQAVLRALWKVLSLQAGRSKGEMMPRGDGAHFHCSKTPYPTSVTMTKESPHSTPLPK